MIPRGPVKLAVAFSLFMAAFPVAADAPQSSDSHVPPNANSEQARSPDLNLLRTRVQRDPVTGQIEITPAPEKRVLTLSPREQNMLSRSDEGLNSTILASGAVAVNLRGRFQSMATARSEPGKSQLEMSCSIIDATRSTDDHAPDVR